LGNNLNYELFAEFCRFVIWFIVFVKFYENSKTTNVENHEFGEISKKTS